MKDKTLSLRVQNLVPGKTQRMHGEKSLWKIYHGKLKQPLNKAGSQNSRDGYRSMLGGKWRKNRLAAKKTVCSLPSN